MVHQILMNVKLGRIMSAQCKLETTGIKLKQRDEILEALLQSCNEDSSMILGRAVIMNPWFFSYFWGKWQVNLYGIVYLISVGRTAWYWI